MAIEMGVSNLSKSFDDWWTPCEVWYEVSIHDIKMKHVSTSSNSSNTFGCHVTHVAGKERWRNFGFAGVSKMSIEMTSSEIWGLSINLEGWLFWSVNFNSNVLFLVGERLVNIL
jgi:hypothetical protein